MPNDINGHYDPTGAAQYVIEQVPSSIKQVFTLNGGDVLRYVCMMSFLETLRCPMTLTDPMMSPFATAECAVRLLLYQLIWRGNKSVDRAPPSMWPMSTNAPYVNSHGVVRVNPCAVSVGPYPH